MANTIQGTFGWDNAPFVNAMADAERVATRGATNIEQRFSNVFRKSRAARGERAITNLLGDLTSGNIAQGLGEFAGRMTGLGVAASLGIGAAVIVFEKFREQIVAAREAHAALESEMTRHPLSVVSKLSTEGMTQALEVREKLAEAARNKSESAGWAATAWEGTKELAAKLAGFDISKKVGKERMDQQKLENKEGEEAKQIMIDRANLAQTLNDIERNRLQGNDREANIAKIILDAEQKRAALQASGVSKKAFDIGDEAISRNAEMQVKMENERGAAKERSLVVEEKMAKLIREGLSGEDQKKVRAGLELQNINAQLASETSGPLRRNLLLQKAQKENELRGMGKPGEENPYNQGTLSARDWERQKDSAKFNENFASLGLTQEQKDRKGPAAPNSEVVSAVNETNEILRQVFLK